MKSLTGMIRASLLASLLASLTASLMFAAPAFGDGHEQAEGPQAIVDQRVETMKQLGGAMKALSAAAKGDKPMDEVAQAAQLVATIGNKLKLMFPEGTAKGDKGVSETRSLPAIWDDKDRFNSLFDGVGDGGTAAMGAVAAGDQAALGAALGQAGKNCKACHDDFRGKKNFLF